MIVESSGAWYVAKIVATSNRSLPGYGDSSATRLDTAALHECQCQSHRWVCSSTVAVKFESSQDCVYGKHHHLHVEFLIGQWCRWEHRGLGGHISSRRNHMANAMTGQFPAFTVKTKAQDICFFRKWVRITQLAKLIKGISKVLHRLLLVSESSYCARSCSWNPRFIQYDFARDRIPHQGTSTIPPPLYHQALPFPTIKIVE